MSGLKDAGTCLQTVYFPFYNIYFYRLALRWQIVHMPVRKRRQKCLKVANFALLLVVFKWHHDSEGVDVTLFMSWKKKEEKRRSLNYLQREQQCSCLPMADSWWETPSRRQHWDRKLTSYEPWRGSDDKAADCSLLSPQLAPCLDLVNRKTG